MFFFLNSTRCFCVWICLIFLLKILIKTDSLNKRRQWHAVTIAVVNSTGKQTNSKGKKWSYFKSFVNCHFNAKSANAINKQNVFLRLINTVGALFYTLLFRNRCYKVNFAGYKLHFMTTLGWHIKFTHEVWLQVLNIANQNSHYKTCKDDTGQLFDFLSNLVCDSLYDLSCLQSGCKSSDSSWTWILNFEY